MGSKRSYADEDAPQLPYKCLKQCVTDEKSNSLADKKPTIITGIHPDSGSNDKPNEFAGRNGDVKPQLSDHFEVKSIHNAQRMVDKGLEDGLRFPWITDSHGDDSGWYINFHRSISPDYFEYNFPRRAHVHLDDTRSSILDSYPRKQVPLGANHQANLPEWVPREENLRNRSAPNSDQSLVSGVEERYMGTCVILMPDSSLLSQNTSPAGAGRKECDCVDKGSARCVRQHVQETRFNLLRDLGEDKFQELGFLDIGEEVAYKWTQEEEQIFHEVVFSNPVSVGKNFWLCLSEEFPSKSMRDLVSYYFNVFMLRKRAAQNRSHSLDIDSDDDEWHPGHGCSYSIGADDDSTLVNDEHSSDEDDDTYDDEGGINEGTGSGKAGKGESSHPNMGFLHKESHFIHGTHDDSCVSFDYQGINESASTKSGLPTKVINEFKNNKYFSLDKAGSDHCLNPGSLEYSGNFRQWDQGFSVGLDHFLPTSNMIEDLFGPGSLDSRPYHD